jgi:hypothetical protein
MCALGVVTLSAKRLKVVRVEPFTILIDRCDMIRYGRCDYHAFYLTHPA